MRQPVDMDKIVALMRYHHDLREAFKNGVLDGKIEKMMEVKCKNLGVSISTFWRYKKSK